MAVKKTGPGPPIARDAIPDSPTGYPLAVPSDRKNPRPAMTGSQAGIRSESATRRLSIAHAAGAVTTATLISRILGVGREVVMAKYFGAGFFTDAFNIAYRIPNLFRDLFAEGALSSAFIPTFIRELNQNGAQPAWALANRLISALLVVLGILTLVFFTFARGFAYLLAAGYADTPGKMDLTVQMTRVMSPFLLFLALAAVTMGMLNAFGSFFVPAAAPASFNVCCILAGIFLSPFMPHFGLAPVVSMAIGALVGGMSQFLVQIPSARRLGWRFHFVLDFSDPGLRRIAHLMLPAIVGLSATQINITVDSQLASQYGNGPVSWLNYAFRLMQLPIGLFGVAIATATTALVSHHAAENATDKLRDTVHSSLRLAACLTFPATVGLIVFRQEIVRLLYQRGSFLETDTVQTGRAVMLYALALFGYSAVKILVPAFYALGDTRTPVRTSVASVALKVAVNFLLILPLQFLGLALATAIASWFNFALLLRRLNRATGGEMHWQQALSVYSRIAAASVVMGVTARLVYAAAQWILPGAGTLRLTAHLGIAILAGMAVIVPILGWFRIEEARELSALVKQRLLRK
jgi:putative peptidoglycan lipid II flippase